MNNRNTLCSWSGGKDSCYALMKAIEQGFSPSVLLNVLNEEGKISRSHGIPAPVLQAQAVAAGIPLRLISSSWSDYESKFTSALTALKEQYGLDYAVFGDIDLQAHRDWEEKVCHTAGLKPVLPLWHQDRKLLVSEMLTAGIETVIVSCNEKMGETFIGRQLTASLADELGQMGIDPCGENGEFHTLVLDCPLFSNPVRVNIGNPVKHGEYWFGIPGPLI